ncbi:MAG: hypothetical protein ABIJ45_05015 [Candidatus Zixiibacteriota bacterium]
MRYTKTQKILNLMTATMVLIGGFYIIIFMPTALSGLARVIIGIVLVAYFLFRVKYSTRKAESELNLDKKNKTLDK